ncbi:MAG: TetR/AcrR family transcriptional regulator [Desulfamplus sp.]|nr:TetR/AcrR family transcriptional regulator [Desulfamplus sp.]
MNDSKNKTNINKSTSNTHMNDATSKININESTSKTDTDNGTSKIHVHDSTNKKEIRRVATKRKILETATHLFARLGYHKTTIQDIAYHIGMTTGAVFHHFASKRDILGEVVDQLNENLEQYIEFLSKEHSDFNDMVRGLVDIFLERFHSEPDSIICLTSLSAEFSGIREPIIINIQQAYDRFVDAFEKAMNRFSRNPANRAVGICFIVALQGIAIQALLRDGVMDIEELVTGFITLTTNDFSNKKAVG